MTAEKRRPLFIKWRRTKIALKVLFAVVVLVLAVRYIVLPVYWRVRAPFAARAYNMHPTADLAEELYFYLDRNIFEEKEGGAVLRMLLPLKIVARDEYRAGETPRAIIDVSNIPNIRPRRSLLRWSSEHSGGWGLMGLLYTPSTVSCPGPPPLPKAFEGVDHIAAPELPGDSGIVTVTRTYTFQLVREQFALRWGKPPQSKGFPWNRIPLYREKLPLTVDAPVLYECEQDLTATFNIVPEGEEDLPRSFTTPELERYMARAVVCKTNATGPSGAVPAGTSVVLHFYALPVNVAFRAFCVDAAGVEHEYPFGSECGDLPKICFRVGFWGDRHMVASWFHQILGPGTHDVTILLRPDPQIGYEDPGMKEIWGGELTFPLSITLSPEEGEDGET